MSEVHVKSGAVENIKGWCAAGLAASVACVLAPFWCIGAVLGALWWAFRDGFMEGSK
jgi:hypothetical protein